MTRPFGPGHSQNSWWKGCTGKLHTVCIIVWYCVCVRACVYPLNQMPEGFWVKSKDDTTWYNSSKRATCLASASSRLPLYGHTLSPYQNAIWTDRNEAKRQPKKLDWEKNAHVISCYFYLFLILYAHVGSACFALLTMDAFVCLR